jgi:hypothetical protein
VLGHAVVLGRLDNADTWICERCGEVTNLRTEPYHTALECDRNTANHVDAQARERGETVTRVAQGSR